MYPRFTLLALLALPLAACNEANMSDFRKGIGLDKEEAAAAVDPTKPRPPAVSPLEIPIETGLEQSKRAVNADAETLNTANFAARANDQSWFVEVTGTTAVYKTPTNQAGRKVTVNRLTFAQGVEYVGTLDSKVFTLNIRSNDCQDAVSGEKFPMTAALTANGKTSMGCASGFEKAAEPAPAEATQG